MAPAATYRECGDVVVRGERYARVRVLRTSCRHGRYVIAGWARTDPGEEGWRALRHPDGWECRYLIRPVRFYCRDLESAAKVRFRPGPGF